MLEEDSESKQSGGIGIPPILSCFVPTCAGVRIRGGGQHVWSASSVSAFASSSSSSSSSRLGITSLFPLMRARPRVTTQKTATAYPGYPIHLRTSLLCTPSPPSYCALNVSLSELTKTLDACIGYLGPVSRNKVMRALELGITLSSSGEGNGVADSNGVYQEWNKEYIPRIVQNVSVACVVSDLQMDCDTVCAALLNGLVKVTAGDEEEEEQPHQQGVMENEVDIGSEVGEEVKKILEIHSVIVSRIEKCGDDNFNEMSYVNLRELILVGAQEEHRSISLLLASAVVDTRALEAVGDVEKRRILANRATYLYAPLANQLGIWYIQSELENLAFMYLQWKEYVETKRLVGERISECQTNLADSKVFLERVLSTAPRVRAAVRNSRVMGRVKGIYSVYRKLNRSKRQIHEIYDLLALRVIVQPKAVDEQSERDACYAIANAIMEHYDTISWRAKDYIAHPKANGYRSLHLTVLPKQGSTPFEIQVRTEKMHHVAEFGAAAHWIYKEVDSDNDSPPSGNGNGQDYIADFNNYQNSLANNSNSSSNNNSNSNNFTSTYSLTNSASTIFGHADKCINTPFAATTITPAITTTARCVPTLEDGGEMSASNNFPPSVPPTPRTVRVTRPNVLTLRRLRHGSSYSLSLRGRTAATTTVSAAPTCTALVPQKTIMVTPHTRPKFVNSPPVIDVTKVSSLTVRTTPSPHRGRSIEAMDERRKGYVENVAEAIRASRVIVASCGQLYQLTIGSTLYDLMIGLGLASLGAIALVNGNVAPLTQRLEMNDFVRFISAVPEL